LRFRRSGQRWEMDVVGCRKPLVVCIDCKHWHRGLPPSSLKRAIEAQVKRTLAFSESLPNPTLRVDCSLWNDAKFVPAILSLTPVSFKFYNGVPVVTIVQLQDFLAQLPMCVDSLECVHKATSYSRLCHGLQQGFSGKRHSRVDTRSKRDDQR
jgi:hypothetical protein